MEKQKLRNEINDKYKWDLTTIFKTDKDFLEEVNKLKKNIKKIDKYSDNMMDNANNLYNCLKLDDEFNSRIEKLLVYASLHSEEDTTNSKYQEYKGIVSNLYEEYAKICKFIYPTLMKYDYEKIEEFYKENSDLKEYEFLLKNIYREKVHSLPEDAEKTLSSLVNAFDKSENVYLILTNSDITFDSIKDENNKEVEITNSNFSNYIKSNNKRVRKDAFKSIYKPYKKYSNTIATCLSNSINSTVAFSKLRNYNSVLERELFADNIDKSVYINLIDTVENNLESLYDYYDFKKKKLNIKDFHIYDIYVPIIKNNKKYSFEEAKDLVIKSLSVLGDDYTKTLKKAFDERWIDVFNNKGKTSGAFSGGCYLTNPFILLNYEGDFDDVSALAHELGHSMHSYYSWKNNLYSYSDYSIFVAEVASIVNELLFTYYMLNNATKKEDKLNILNNLLELYKGTLFRQTMFAKFEKEIYEAVENGEILTSDYLCNKYYDINKKYYGKNVILDEEIKYEWERVPHFYNMFYVYMYATSICAATYIVNEILNGNEKMKENYLKFLTLGSTKYPIDELKTLGIDMNDKKVIKNTIDNFQKILNEFKELDS